MARPIHLVVLASVVLVGVGVAVLLEQVRQLRSTQEQIMAKFEGLDADLTELKQTVAEAAQRVEDAVARLLDDTADQAQIDEARVEVRDAIDVLKAIAPAEEPQPEPVEPTPGPAGPEEPAG